MNQPFLRFLLVSIIHTAAGLSIMHLLYRLPHVPYWQATLAGIAASAVISYILNRTFTFQSNVSIIKSTFRFIAVMIVCYYCSYRLSTQLTDWAALTAGIISPRLANNAAILLGAGFYTILNYIGQKQFVFFR
ncbi:GtrA family protein [Parageobacillus thermoglucosidasius]|jgi:putative flippase GtrA|uniref:Sugar translocase n=3 Tax=Anoxybacillaceae TaxID=3120669 RepID=A0AAN0YM73_PARTM|nr:GtrA family protein [Parageobacillus thermoglucosidasius]REK56424.1 MAG: GtrA family protein [Geobacillus sp.]AEH46443.1 GtrA family protein [Parageobacillus thermoglucosidasius C56-YS93]ALF08726.1 sugar translocase [Parageobacillus thermoglucosidasius]ANZ28810.1 sugar translocase [Parageobacillus thermoglucosidasius]APM79547.1 sugar translocase [Parageobacillus thermoglucosidasius]